MLSMGNKEFLRQLENERILIKEDGSYRFTTAFDSTVRELDDSTIRTQQLEEKLGETDLQLDIPSEVSKRTLCKYMQALSAYDLSEEQTIIGAHVLTLIAADSAGAFVMVPGPRMTNVLTANEKVIFLISKDDCEPCDEVRERITGLAESGDIPEEIILGEVIGPDNKQLLYTEYDITGAPTLLFGADGRIEMRLVGNRTTKEIRNAMAKAYSDLSALD